MLINVDKSKKWFTVIIEWIEVDKSGALQRSYPLQDTPPN